MRRQAPINNRSSRRSPLLLGGLALLLFAIYRVYSIHGDLQELHQTLNQQQNAVEGSADAIQVIMPEEEDVLFRNASSKPINVILSYPHIDECRQCSVCIPQSYIDQQLGNSSSSSSRWWGKLWARQLLEQQQQQLQRHKAWFLSVPGHINGSSNGNVSRSTRKQRSWLRQQQQWLTALRAAVGDDIAGSTTQAGPTRQQPKHQQQTQQQQLLPLQQLEQQQGMLQWHRQLQEVYAPGSRPHPRLDGVQTHKAWLAKQAAGVANTDTHAVPGVEVILSMPDNSFKWQGATYHIGPASLQMDQRKIRHCKVCRGCRQQLKPMPKGVHWMGSSFFHDPGASDGWLSTAASPDGKTSVVKVWCTPVPKPGSHVPAVCKPSAIREQLQLVLALQNIAKDCQLGELLPHTWIGPVDGVLPGSHGYRVLWDGLWSDLEVGVSAENLIHRGEPRVQPTQLLHYLHHHLNSTQVIVAAVFDLLFSQCDRHGQNLYLKPDGAIVLIDNDQSYGASWRPCGVDSLFLPGTQKFEVERLGFSYVMKKPEYAPPKAARAQLSPMQLLDYRCHLPKGQQALGTDYPRPITQCLKKLSKMDPDRIAAKYGYPHPRMAAAVHQRAQDMLTKGFEWTLKNGWPRNPVPMRYKWAKGCCKMQCRQQDSSSSAAAAAVGGSDSSDDSSNSSSSSGSGPDQGIYKCTRWAQEDLGWHTDLPIGDPVSGMAWEHNGVDSGSYSLETEGEGQH